MKRVLMLVAVAASGMLALPALATADRGWKLPKVKSERGDRVFTSKAKRCGASRFGAYKFRNAARIQGRWGYVVYRAKVTRNGALHRAKILRFGGKLPRRVKARTRRLLKRVKFRYAGGPPPIVESIQPNGTRQASRPFNPVRARC